MRFIRVRTRLLSISGFLPRLFIWLCVWSLAFGGVQLSRAQSETNTPAPTSTGAPPISPTWGAIQTNTPSVLTATPAVSPTPIGCPDEAIDNPDDLNSAWVAQCSRCLAGAAATPVATIQQFTLATVPPIGTVHATTALPTLPPLYGGGTNTPVPTNTPAPTGTPSTWTVTYDWVGEGNSLGWVADYGVFSLTGFVGALDQIQNGGGINEAGAHINFEHAVQITSVQVFLVPYSGFPPNTHYIRFAVGESYVDWELLNQIDQGELYPPYSAVLHNFVPGEGQDNPITTSQVGLYYARGGSGFFLSKVIINGVGASPVDVLDHTPTPIPTEIGDFITYDCAVPVYVSHDPVADVDLSSDIVETDCYTVIPEINVTISDPDINYDGLQICVNWTRVPSVTWFGITLSIDLLAIIPAAYLLKRAFQF